ncbi:MAG TPA: hypothetical protein VNK82_06285 [Terriglobales bacterium]|nr:hypothetical protein [Terriglobales bacterium]
MARNAQSTLSTILAVGILTVSAYLLWRDPEGAFNRLRDVWEAIKARLP